MNQAFRKLGPYYHLQRALGAQFVDRMGFAAALHYKTTQLEHLATRERVGLYDVYNQVLVDVQGRDAEALLRKTLVNSVSGMRNGKVLYSSVCREDGGMIDDLTCFRSSPTHFLLCPTPSRVEHVVDWMRREAAGLDVLITNRGAGSAFLSVQGPLSRALLSGMTKADLSDAALPYFNFVNTTIADVPEVIVSRTGYSGELGYEMFYPREYAEYLWEAVMEAGASYGIEPCGLGALRSVRIEKRYPLYGLDLSETTTPFEAGLDWTVRFDDRAFIGRESLLSQRDRGVGRRLVCIAFEDLSFVPPTGSAIFADGKQIGTVTSADSGWYVGRALALGYVPSGFAIEGETVDVHSNQDSTARPGKLSLTAVHDPLRTRMRGDVVRP